MAKHKWTFDSLFCSLIVEIPLIGKPIWNYYKNHGWFSRFVKFGIITTVIYWFIRAPMIWFFAEVVPITVTVPFLFVIPAYLFSAFLVGLILTVVSFVMSEGWIWKKKGGEK